MGLNQGFSNFSQHQNYLDLLPGELMTAQIAGSHLGTY